MTWPHAWNYYLSPLGTRPAWDRRPVAAYGKVPGLFTGQVPGTPAYVEAGQGGTTVAVSIPAAYLWDGHGAVPAALADLADVLVAIFGGSGLPSRANGPAWAAALAQIYAGLQECGVSYATITEAIATHAPDTHAIAYAIQQDALSRPTCAAAVQNPIAAPSSATPPTSTSLVSTNGAKNGAAPAATKPFPWGWVAGGFGVLAIVGIAIYFGTRRPKRRRRNPMHEENPCGTCPNPGPEWIEATGVGYDVLEAPARSGTRKNPRRGRRHRRSAKKARSASRSSRGAGKRKRKRRNMAESTREHLPAREFAIPERRAYPIQSERQAIRALSFADWPQNRKDRKRVRHAVFARYPDLFHSPPYRPNEYGGTLGFPGIQPDIMALQSPVMSPIVRKNAARRRGARKKNPKGGTKRHRQRRER